MEPANLSLCFNGVILDIGLCTDIYSNWLTWIIGPTSGGFHKRWTSRVAFDSFAKSNGDIVVGLEGTGVGTGEKMAEVSSSWQ